MLSLQESRFLLKYLEIWSKVYIFPFTVNISSGKLVQFPRGRMELWRLLYLLAVFHCLYGLFNVIYMLILQREHVVLYHLPVQFDGVLVPLVLYPTIAIALISNVQLVAKLFNELYNSESRQNSVRHWMKLNVTELLPTGVCLVAIGGIGSLMIMILVESSMCHLLINSRFLMSHRGNMVIVIIAHCIELYSLALWIINVGFLLSMSALVIAKVQQELNDVQTNLRRCESIEGIEAALRTSKKLQLYIQLYNGFNAWFLHAVKTLAILAAIVHGYFGVRFRNNVILSAFCFFVHVDTYVLYCGAFQRAYQLVSGQSSVRRNIVTVCRQVRDQNTIVQQFAEWTLDRLTVDPNTVSRRLFTETFDC